MGLADLAQTPMPLGYNGGSTVNLGHPDPNAPFNSQDAADLNRERQQALNQQQQQILQAAQMMHAHGVSPQHTGPILAAHGIK